MSGYVQIRHEEYVSLREEVQVLRRKFKYIQGVSTVFRQRVAFIVTDLSQRPDEITSKDLQMMYARAIKELRVLDTELSTTVATDLPAETPLDADRRAQASAQRKKAALRENRRRERERGGDGGVVGSRYTFSGQSGASSSDEQEASLSDESDGDARPSKHNPPTRDAPSYEELAEQLKVAGSTGAISGAGELQRRGEAWAKDRERWDDVRKAHHLCTLLAEKNEAVQATKQLKEAHESSRARYEGLKGKYERLLSLLQDKGVHAATDAQSVALQQELNEQRVARLQDEMAELRGKLVKSERALETYSSNPSGLVEDVRSTDETVVSLTQENKQLQQQVQRLNGHIAAVKTHSAGVISDVQGSTDKFMHRIWELQQTLASKNDQIQDLTAEAYDLRQEREEMGSHVGHYVKQLEALSHEHEVLSKAFDVLKHTTADENDELAGAVTEYASHVSERDSHIASLRKELLEEKHEGHRLQVQNQLLIAQLQSARSQQSELRQAEQQRGLQKQSAMELQRRMSMALAEMQELHSSGPLSDRLARLHDQIDSLEGVEAQLRLKDDQLAMVQDECDKLRASHDELHAALNSVSSLFASMPASVGDMEKLLLEYDVYSSELRRCSTSRAIPDLTRVEGLVEMRLMEAKHAKRDVLVQHGKNIAASSRATPQDDDDDAQSLPASYEHLLTVPPPPALVDITNALANITRGDSDYPTSASPTTTGSPASAKVPSHTKGPRTFNAASSAVTSFQRDARTAFDLFAEKGRGPEGETVLVGDQVRLCWQTLGLDSEDLRKALSTFRPSIPQSANKAHKVLTFEDFLTLAAAHSKR